MGGGAWKVAYADFVTAMMAFFLLMWLINPANKVDLKGMAGYFQPDATLGSMVTSPTSAANNDMVQYPDKLDTRESFSEAEQSAIAMLIKSRLLADAVPSSSSGITSDNVGVMLRMTSNAMFQPNSEELAPDGLKALGTVADVMNKYKVFLIVRGHADSSETGAPKFRSNWELASARANAAVIYLVSRGIDPQLIRSVSYADTAPRVPPGNGALQQNARVEFYFHRPEVKSTIVNY